MFFVNLQVFSGRPDPQWWADLPDLPRILRNLNSGGPASEMEAGLGYSGVQVLHSPLPLWRGARGVWAWRDRVLPQGSAFWLADPGCDVERYLLASAPAELAPLIFSIVTSFGTKSKQGSQP